MAQKQEMVADIVAEMRDYSNTCNDGYHTDYGVVRTDMRNYANRLEAAWKRERAEAEAKALEVGGIVAATAEKSSAVGNAAAMRKALEELVANIEMRASVFGIFTFTSQKTFLDAKAALAKPPRNCDVYRTSWEVLKHWDGGLDSAQSVVNMLDWLLDKAKGEADEQK